MENGTRRIAELVLKCRDEPDRRNDVGTSRIRDTTTVRDGQRSRRRPPAARCLRSRLASPSLKPAADRAPATPSARFLGACSTARVESHAPTRPRCSLRYAETLVWVTTPKFGKYAKHTDGVVAFTAAVAPSGSSGVRELGTRRGSLRSGRDARRTERSADISVPRRARAVVLTCSRRTRRLRSSRADSSMAMIGSGAVVARSTSVEALRQTHARAMVGRSFWGLRTAARLRSLHVLAHVQALRR